MRLRLRCHVAYALGDLQWCMVHVPDHVLSVRDLACHISRLLELNLRGGNAEPPQLLLDGFLVPHDEEVREVLRDDEVIDVEPTEPGTALQALPAPDASGGKRPLAAAAAAPDGKKPRRNAQQAAAMALGWQPEATGSTGPAPKAKASAKVAQDDEESDESSSEEEQAAAAPTTSAPKGKGSGAKAPSPAETAQALALATCGDNTNASSVNASSSDASCGIFVGGLPWELTDSELKKHFEHYGGVESASVMMNEKTGKSKGFGFVEFKDAAARDKAMAAGSKQEIWGRTVEVKLKHAKGGKNGKGKDDKKGKGGGKGKDGTKGKNGKDGKDKGGKGKKPQVRKMDEDDDDDSDEDEESAPAGSAASQRTKQPAEPVMTEEMKQMMALGLPVSFTASETKGGDESDDEDEEEEEEEEEGEE
eukprot:TRINITY_DN40681_c0_g1_i1.p1 TRINITY_DN40681_c0_g1~~TRINITY_DN40681_c0_g1_i1.p1  ORF type:complete len:420 (+),score=144.27 TRINITY_DN40681_c0_g1_i1:37-1296(+)